MTPRLSERLKIETRALHTAAERSTFMRTLLRGEMQAEAYRALLTNLLAIYAALEPALARHAEHPCISPIYIPALWRSRALEMDLLRLQPSLAQLDSRSGIRHATRTYVSRIHAIDEAQPGLLLAHAYVRYLGDLSGGQMLRKIVGQSLQIGGGSCVAFYDFGDEVETKSLIRAFREGMTKVPPDPALEDSIVAEAKTAFRLHCELFDELAKTCGLVDDPHSTKA